MSKFNITEDKFSYISEKLNIEEKSVRAMFDEYNKLAAKVKYQYMAHVIRTIETAIRQKIKNDNFRIFCIPLNDDGDIVGFGNAQYYENEGYIIFFNPKMEERLIRIVIAHELGHLFCEIFGQSVFSGISEPLSSLFGIFAIMDKNNFYNQKDFPFQHETWQDIIKDFTMLANRENNVFNVSNS